MLRSPPDLVTASAARLLAVSVVAAAVHVALLPEVDHVHQQLFAGAAHEAGRVPHLVVAGPLGVDGRFAPSHRLLAVMARLEGDKRRRECWWWVWMLLPTSAGFSSNSVGICYYRAVTQDNLHLPTAKDYIYNL